MKRAELEKVLSPVSGVQVREVHPYAEVMYGQDGEVNILEDNEVRELSDLAYQSLRQRLHVSQAMVNRLKPSTAGKVMTELLQASGATSIMHSGDYVQGFAESGRYKNIGVERVLDAVETVFGADVDYERAVVSPTCDVHLEIVGEETLPVVKGDLVRAGTVVKFNPMGMIDPRVQTFAVRLACTNGMTSTDVLETFTLAGADVDDLDEWMRENIERSYLSVANAVDRWADLAVDAIVPEDRSLVLGSLIKRSRLKRAEEKALWARATEEQPETAYDMLNLMTWLSTHVLTDYHQVGRAQSASDAFVDEALHQKYCMTCNRDRLGGGEAMSGGGLQKYTPAMRRAEERLGGPLETTLAPFVTECGGVTRASQRLGVDKGNVKYWLVKLGVSLQYVAIGPSDRLTIERGQEVM